MDAMLYIVKGGDPARVDAISVYKENDSWEEVERGLNRII